MNRELLVIVFCTSVCKLLLSLKVGSRVVRGRKVKNKKKSGFPFQAFQVKF